MNKEEIINALERLEEKLHDIGGYMAPQILFEMGIPVTRSHEVRLRKLLRSMMKDDDYANPGPWNIVYTPGGWGSGTYRLVKYRDEVEEAKLCDSKRLLVKHGPKCSFEFQNKNDMTIVHDKMSRSELKNEGKTNKCYELHLLFNSMKRYNYKTINDIPFDNGVYIFFGEDEKYAGMDRIIRVGTDTQQNRLKERMKQHLLTSNKDGSIFRKNIGRAMLNKEQKIELLKYWNIKMSKPENKKYFNNELQLECRSLENKITNYLCANMEFVVFNLEKAEDRLRYEEAIIATLHKSKDFKASENWLGNYVPTNIKNNHVVDSRMWISQGINAKELTDAEFQRLMTLCSDGIDSLREEKILEIKQENSIRKFKKLTELLSNIDD